MSTISKKYQGSSALTLERLYRGVAAPVLFGILFFFVVCLGAADSIKGMVMAAMAFSLLVIAMRFKLLRDRIQWPLIALTLYVLMDGISTFYAVSGKFALKEFLKVLLAFLLAVILTAASPKKEETRGKRVAMVLAVCAALTSLVSIDLISTRWISGAVIGILESFTTSFSRLEAIQPGIRLDSMFENPNVQAGISGIGVLLSLALASRAEEKGERNTSLVLLFLNSLAFVLVFSMGATAFLGLAFLLLLIFEPKESRYGLFLTMLETLVLVGVATVLIAKTSFHAWTGFRPIPLLCCIVGSAALCVLNALIGKSRIARIHIQKKVLITIGVVIVLAAAAFIVVAWNWTGPIQLAPGETLRRTMKLEPGTYTVSVKADQPLSLTVSCRNYEEVIVGRSNYLYEKGDVQNVVIDVPDDALLVFFDFDAETACRIERAACNETEIPLGYKLLPSFIANRFQGMWANRNFLLRFVHVSDGLKLFRRSPIIGLGMGAYENGIKSVQSFYFETKYAHNHYVQCLTETGVIGLLLFLFLWITSGIAVWRSRKTHPLAPAFEALLVFMAGHAIIEVTFSSQPFLPMAYGVFALISLCCGETIKKPKLTNAARTVCIGIATVCSLIYCGFLASNMMAKNQADREPSMQTLVRCVSMDRFEWADYALPYVINAEGDNVNPYVRQQADVFAEKLAKVNSNTIPIYLAEYYFQSDRPEQGIEMVEKYVDYVASDERAWQQAFDLLKAYSDGSEVFRSGVVRVAQKLDTWRAKNPGTIRINETAQAFIAECRSA